MIAAVTTACSNALLPKVSVPGYRMEVARRVYTRRVVAELHHGVRVLPVSFVNSSTAKSVLVIGPSLPSVLELLTPAAAALLA